MGLSLMPSYYKEKVNVFAALAPPVFIKSITDPMTLKEASHWKLLMKVLEKVHYYNTFVFAPEWHEAIVEVCNLAPSLCKILADSGFLIKDVDNMQRGDVMLSNFPSGAGYRTTIYYG